MKQPNDREREAAQVSDSPLERVTGEPDAPPEPELADTKQSSASPDKSRHQDDT
ncbi:hypothetical protein ACFZAU_25325 [Streptomyces sp. NPDC008238]